MRRCMRFLLRPLALKNIGRLVTDAIHCGPECARAVGTTGAREDRGAIRSSPSQFLTALVDEKLLVFDQEKGCVELDFALIKAQTLIRTTARSCLVQ